MDKAKLIISGRELLAVLWPMIISFVAAKIIIQTDLIMIAPLGAVKIAAFAVPTRIMFIDTIVAFTIAPVVAVMISTSVSDEQKLKSAENSLSFTFYISILLTVICLYVYPYIVNHIVKDHKVADLARSAVFWLTLAIPSRLFQFVCTMIIFANHRGSSLLPIYITSVIINLVLNWITIYYFRMGFSGAYISTFISSYLTMGATLLVLDRRISLACVIKFPARLWVINFLRVASFELVRLISWQFLVFITLMLFASNTAWVSRLSAYGVATELYLIVTMPFIAVMRSVSILLGSRIGFSASDLYYSSKNIALLGTVWVIILSMILLLISKDLGVNIYRLPNESMLWWTSFVWVCALVLPIAYLNSIQRGIWQSKKQYRFILTVELFCSWVIYFPVIYLGLVNDNPWIAWGGMLITEVVTALIFFLSKKN